MVQLQYLPLPSLTSKPWKTWSYLSEMLQTAHTDLRRYLQMGHKSTVQLSVLHEADSSSWANKKQWTMEKEEDCKCSECFSPSSLTARSRWPCLWQSGSLTSAVGLAVAMATHGTVAPALLPVSALSELMVPMFALCSSRKLFFQITALAKAKQTPFFSPSLCLCIFFSLAPFSSVSLQRGVIQFSEYTSGRRSVKTHLSFHNACEFFHQMLLIGIESWNSEIHFFFFICPVIWIFWRLFFLGSRIRQAKKSMTQFSSETCKKKKNSLAKQFLKAFCFFLFFFSNQEYSMMNSLVFK